MVLSVIFPLPALKRRAIWFRPFAAQDSWCEIASIVVEVYSSLRGMWEGKLFARNFVQEKAPPAGSREEPGKNRDELEAELDGQLNAARTSAAEERVANADVGGGAELVTARLEGLSCRLHARWGQLEIRTRKCRGSKPGRQ